MNSELEALAGQVRETDQVVRPAPAAPPAAAVPDLQQQQQQQQPAAPAVDYVAEARLLLTMAVEASAPLFPSLRAVYTKEAIGQLAEALGPVLAKYGMSALGMLTRWEAELRLLMVAFPIAMQTRAAIVADIAMQRAAAAAARAARDPTAVSGGASSNAAAAAAPAAPPAAAVAAAPA